MTNFPLRCGHSSRDDSEGGRNIMTIGKFNIAGTSYTGVIETLTFKTEAVFEPVEKKTDKSPDFRITNGEADIGVAWKETSEKTGNSYLSS
jgi:uncharacterized protein (DUF736 family)